MLAVVTTQNSFVSSFRELQGQVDGSTFSVTEGFVDSTLCLRFQLQCLEIDSNPSKVEIVIRALQAWYSKQFVSQERCQPSPKNRPMLATLSNTSTMRVSFNPEIGTHSVSFHWGLSDPLCTAELTLCFAPSDSITTEVCRSINRSNI